MLFGRDEVPKDKREYKETFDTGFRLDYLLAVIFAFVCFFYLIYKTELEGVLKNPKGGVR